MGVKRGLRSSSTKFSKPTPSKSNKPLLGGDENPYVDTQFCTHNLIKENDLNDQSMYPKNHNCITCINLFLHYIHHFVFALHTSFCLCITCINSFIAYHKNYLMILTVTTVFPVFKSGHQIERYRMIKFAWSTYIVSR